MDSITLDIEGYDLIRFKTACVPDWSQARGTVNLLTVSVTQLQSCMKDGNEIELF